MFMNKVSLSLTSFAQQPSFAAQPNKLSEGALMKTQAARLPSSPLLSRPSAATGLREKLLAAREKYEVRLSPADLARHVQNQAHIANAVQDFKNGLVQEDANISPQAIRLLVEENIASILQKAEFDPHPYRAKGSGVHDYGKYLVYTDENRGAPFCFQFFRFNDHQKTPIHDHPCDCTSLVVFGQVRERHYEKIAGQLIKTKKEDRFPGSRRAIDMQANQPHSIKNSSDAPAGTLHVYRIDGVEQAAAVRTIFSASDVHGKLFSAAPAVKQR